MTLNEFIENIKKLIGLELRSIRPGANITILDVDVEKGSILVQTSQDVVRSRPISEIELLWSELLTKPAVHVEGALHGSGTSRNQPETILANLPYIEWLKISNKKHISFVGEATHPYGTLKLMDPVVAAGISLKMKSKDNHRFNAIIVNKDINQSISILSKICSGSVKALEQGVYKYETLNGYLMFLSKELTDLEEGTYFVFESMSNTTPKYSIKIDGKTYGVIDTDGIKGIWNLK